MRSLDGILGAHKSTEVQLSTKLRLQQQIGHRPNPCVVRRCGLGLFYHHAGGLGDDSGQAVSDTRYWARSDAAAGAAD